MSARHSREFMHPDPAARRLDIQAALLEFHRTPGRYALIRRQPSQLFSSIKDVLHLASGREPGDAQGVAPADAVRLAACFFVRSALLHPAADHYALLGLDRSADAGVIKERYRQMMRLLHPDFSSPGAHTTWPADTAARVNRAYGVLGSVVERKLYDESLDKQPPPTPPAPEHRPAAVALRQAAAKPPAEDPRRRLKFLAIVFGSLGSLALVAIFLASGERESLVQRPASLAEPVVEKSLPAKVVEAISMPREAPPRALEAPSIEAPPVLAQPVVNIPAPPTPFVATVPIQSAPPLVISITPDATPALPAFVPPSAPAKPAPAPTVPVPVAVAVAVPLAPPNPGVTMAQVHPLLSRLVQHVESGSGDRLLVMLDRDARGTPAAQALVSQYNAMVEGSRGVKVSQVQFKSEPLEGRLRVTGFMLVDVGGSTTSSAGKEFSLQAEFVSRDGVVTMTRLARTR